MLHQSSTAMDVDTPSQDIRARLEQIRKTFDDAISLLPANRFEPYLSTYAAHNDFTALQTQPEYLNIDSFLKAETAIKQDIFAFLSAAWNDTYDMEKHLRTLLHKRITFETYTQLCSSLDTLKVQKPERAEVAESYRQQIKQRYREQGQSNQLFRDKAIINRNLERILAAAKAEEDKGNPDKALTFFSSYIAAASFEEKLTAACKLLSDFKLDYASKAIAAVDNTPEGKLYASLLRSQLFARSGNINEANGILTELEKHPDQHAVRAAAREILKQIESPEKPQQHIERCKRQRKEEVDSRISRGKRQKTFTEQLSPPEQSFTARAQAQVFVNQGAVL